MPPKDAIAVVWGVLIFCLVQCNAQFYDTQAASLSKAPVGLYSRQSIFGDLESASSLSGAPVGLYGKRQFPRFPIIYPALYPSPLLFGLPQYGKFPFVSNVKRPVRYPPPVVSRPPSKSGYKQPGVSPRFLGGGGLLGLGGLLGGGLL